MNYKTIGHNFCEEINLLLKNNHISASFVTGGGFAYDSIKYNNKNKIGDFDFMIIYENQTDVKKIIELLKTTNFNFEKKYIDLDLKLLFNGKIDIIRLSGVYNNIKSTINLVPKQLIKDICELKKEIIIKKISHSRNTSLFFAYGSDNSRITITFISPSFITEDGEDHYIHLDFSHIKQNGNIYLGILADAILKGFNINYDNIEFNKIRKQFIINIHNFFEENNIDSNNYLNLFANNIYFPEYLKEKLKNEFNQLGIIHGRKKSMISHLPIILSTDFNIDYKSKPFNFINNKELNMTFKEYILKMQNNEYDRQYLIDALGKFFGYILSSNTENKKCDEINILDKILVYGTNDLYLPNIKDYSKTSIIISIINDLKRNINELNYELFKNYIIICSKFLSMIQKQGIEIVLNQNNIDKGLFIDTIDNEKMDINIIKDRNSFNELGTYHNYTSKVMSDYTKKETEIISRNFGNKNGKVLDIMCGYGRIANQLKKAGYNDIVGIDFETYQFLGVEKDFIFIKDDFLTHNFTCNFDYAYSLYNSYKDKDELNKILNKIYLILKTNGILIFDCFNKQWRDSINADFYKELYVDDKYKLDIQRHYDINSANEQTIYRLYYKNQIIKEYDFNQNFFELNDITEIINKDNWEYIVGNSSDIETKTRNNSQKHILVMRKK